MNLKTKTAGAIRIFVLVMVALFAVGSLFSCKKNKQRKNDDITEIYVEINDKKTNVSDFIEKVEVIKLETNDNCLISHISKIVYENEKFYVFDMRVNSIFIFNKDGSCDTVLSKRGIGPGEYLQIIDFNVIDNYIFIMDYSRSILKYNSNMEFENEIVFNSFSSQFILKSK
jgi:hypothetical protein